MKHDADTTALENSRAVLDAPGSLLPDLVRAAEAAAGVARAASRALEAELAGRERTLAGAGRASELEGALRLHDDAIGGFKRRLEVANATSKALIRRIDEMREAEAARERLQLYHATSTRLASLPAKIASALAQMTEITRSLLMETAVVDIDVNKVNASLPPGCARLASVESCRVEKSPEPVFREIRRGRFYIEEGSGRVLGAEGQVAASLRPDKKFDVILPGGATSGGMPTVASLQELAEIEVTEYSARGWPEQLALAIRIPGMTLADPPGWDIPTDRGQPAYPDQILARLDKLENRAPAPPLPPKVTRRLIPVARWEAEQAQAQQKAA